MIDSAQSLEELATLLGLEARGSVPEPLTGIADLTTAGSSDISFCADDARADDLERSRAGLVIVTPDLAARAPGAVLVSADPKLDFTRLTARIFPEPGVGTGIHPSASIDQSARLGAGVFVGAGAVIGRAARIGDRTAVGEHCTIGEGAVIGTDCRLRPHVVIHGCCRMGDRCNIEAGAVIGSRGFGLVEDGDRWLPFPQRGRVIIGNDVDIGANTCIDRGALTDTVIGDGVKLDNMVQIAHNVVIGEHTVMAAFCGVAGSTTIGRRCRFGGRSSIMDHISIADDVVVAATSFVARSVNEPGMFSSAIPAQPVNRWRKIAARLSRLDELAVKIRKLAR